MKKLIFLFIIITVASFLGWQIYQNVSFSSKKINRRQNATPVAVKVTPIQKITIHDIRLFTGTLYPRSQFIVAPKINGRLEKLYLNIGDIVKKNQLIAVLDDDEYLQQVDQARAELEVAKANLEESRNALETSKRELERTVVLRKKKIASESELDSARAQYRTQEAKLKVASAQLLQKKAALKAAKVRLSYTQIKAPRDNKKGYRVVGERFVDEGAMLAPNAAIVSILDIGFMTAVIHVIERDYSRIKVGQDAVITTDAFPGKKFFGKIIRVAPLLKVTSREARVEIEIPNPKGLLKPGMFARAQIEFSRHENATVVPIDSLVKRNGQQGVFLADTRQKKAFFTPITIGITNGKLAEIINPSLTGFVVSLGQHLLLDGSAIIVPENNSRYPIIEETDSKAAEQKKGLDSGGNQ